MSKESGSNNSSSSGIGFCGLLTIVFIVLKLTHFINWSWLWVLAPSWIPLAIVIVVALICVAVGVIQHIIRIIKHNKRLKAKRKSQGDVA
jgi:hypothetical protein